MALKHRLEGIECINALPFGQIIVNFKNEPFLVDELYKLMREWLVEEEWQGERGPCKDDAAFPEVYYLQRVNPQLGRDIWWRWRLHKYPFPGAKFWKFLLDIDAHALWIKPVELVIKDKKIKAEQGEMEVQFNAYLQYDSNKDWEKSAWLNPFKKIWVNRIKIRERDDLIVRLRKDVNRLQELVKNFFALQTYLPEKEFIEFYPKKTPET